jgi:hypothetical protein
VDNPAAYPPADGDSDHGGGVIEVADGGADGPEAIDEIDAGGSLLPSRLARLVQTGPLRRATSVATAVLALVVAAAVVDAVATRPSIIAGIPSAAPIPPATSSPFERVLGLVQEKRLTGNIRQASEPSACTTVTPGHSPEQAVLTVLHEQLLQQPSGIETARTLDQFTGLCSLQVRVDEPGGVRLVVLISSPPGRPDLLTLDALEVGLENIGAQSVEYVSEAEHTGWEILIGAVGPPGALPRTSDLARAAGEPQLQW